MDAEFLKWFTSLGVGGIVAAIIFHFYRKDVKHYTDQWKGQSEMLVQVVKENTAAQTKLTSTIEGSNDRQDERDNRQWERDMKLISVIEALQRRNDAETERRR